MRQQLQAHEEIKKQMEEDEDREIQDIKIKYERWLIEEKESNLQLKGEIGVMNKRVSLICNRIVSAHGDLLPGTECV